MPQKDRNASAAARVPIQSSWRPMMDRELYSQSCFEVQRTIHGPPKSPSKTRFYLSHGCTEFSSLKMERIKKKRERGSNSRSIPQLPNPPLPNFSSPFSLSLSLHDLALSLCFCVSLSLSLAVETTHVRANILRSTSTAKLHPLSKPHYL